MADAKIEDFIEDKEKGGAAVGEKHTTKNAEPEAKRVKTEEGHAEKQAHLDAPDAKNEENDVGKGDLKEPKKEEGGGGGDADAGSDENKSAVQPGKEPDVPSSILEKGIIYFFIRGRVNIEKPSSVNDIRRSYIILRPIPRDAALGKGPIGDVGNTRLIALPKKVLPSSGRDRFMAFVEKSGASFDELKGQFLASEDYVTRTAGTRHTPAATPVGEGVYAITTTGRESHLAYMLTLPEDRGQVQEELGLKEKGSFIISTKNPKYPSPSNASLPQGPDYPWKILQDFRALRWMPSRPDHLNYVNAQILMIGESSHFERAVTPSKEDEKEGKEEPAEALENLEEEDLERMRDLGQGASIFQDLKVHAEGYPKLQTTF